MNGIRDIVVIPPTNVLFLERSWLVHDLEYVCRPTYQKEEVKLVSYVNINTYVMVVSPCGLTPIFGIHL